MKHWRITFLLLFLMAVSALADTRYEGYYSVWASADRNDEQWHFGMPSHYAEMKFITSHAEGLESYFRLRANANSDDDRTIEAEYYTPPWIAAEGHIKYRTNNSETMFFSRQNHFWINDEPLFGLVNDWKLKNDNWGPQAQGIKHEFWDRDIPLLGKWGGTVVYSDDGGTYNWGNDEVAAGVDSWIIRTRKNSWDDRIVGGLMFLRKDWTDTSSPENTGRLGLMYNQIYEADIALFPRDLMKNGLSFGPVDLEQSRWTMEYAWSQVPYNESVYNTPTDHAYLFGAEVRDIHIGNFMVHGWFNNAGENFRDYMSSRYDDERQYNQIYKHAEAIYFVPRKAITAKVAYDNRRLRIPDEVGHGLRPSEELYAELYVEFINGFKGKTAYKQWHGFDADTDVNAYATYPDLFGEISVENFLAKIRLQFRLHDFNTFRESTAFGFDMNVNLTEKLKGYLRMLNASDTIESRQSAFAQLKYDLGPGAELYFEYGDPGQSDGIVYTDWFISAVDPDSGGRNPHDRILKNRLALSFRTWF